MATVQLPAVAQKRKARNKSRIIGQNRPLLPKQVWAIRQLRENTRPSCGESEERAHTGCNDFSLRSQFLLSPRLSGVELRIQIVTHRMS
jgi:hypothetical protein